MAFPPTDWLDWTTAEYEVGAPATSLSFERWFRNPVALAQGAVGAPRIEFAALGGWYTTTGAVGTYAFATVIGGGRTNTGALVAGSNLQYDIVTGPAALPTALPGTWRNMGGSVISGDSTLFMRVY